MLIEREDLMEIIDHDLGILSEMITAFDKDLSSMLERINKALEEGQGSEASGDAHGLKGLFSTLGSTRGRDTAAQLEDALKEGNTSKAQDLLEEVRRIGPLVKEEAKDILVKG